MTETGMSLGTPHYMSPEQAMGEREITARSDIYALGCVPYEMLAGEPPFRAPPRRRSWPRVLTESPRSLRPQRKSVPPNVEAAVLTALEKLPADRFDSAKAFAEALADPAYSGASGSATRAIRSSGTAGSSVRSRQWLAAAASPWSLAPGWRRDGSLGTRAHPTSRRSCCGTRWSCRTVGRCPTPSGHP